MKIVVVGVLIGAFITMGNAQVSVSGGAQGPLEQSVYGLGLSAGLASGFGLSFRHHLPGFFSYQIVGGIIKFDDKTAYNFGTELQWDFVRNDVVRFFGMGATGFFFSGKGGENDLSAPLRIGAGVGGEWERLQPFNFSAEILFTYFTDGTILPLPQLAAHYYF